MEIPLSGNFSRLSWPLQIEGASVTATCRLSELHVVYHMYAPRQKLNCLGSGTISLDYLLEFNFVFSHALILLYCLVIQSRNFVWRLHQLLRFHWQLSWEFPARVHCWPFLCWKLIFSQDLSLEVISSHNGKCTSILLYTPASSEWACCFYAQTINVRCLILKFHLWRILSIFWKLGLEYPAALSFAFFKWPSTLFPQKASLASKVY